MFQGLWDYRSGTPLNSGYSIPALDLLELPPQFMIKLQRISPESSLKADVFCSECPCRKDTSLLSPAFTPGTQRRETFSTNGQGALKAKFSRKSYKGLYSQVWEYGDGLCCSEHSSKVNEQRERTADVSTPDFGKNVK